MRYLIKFFLSVIIVFLSVVFVETKDIPKTNCCSLVIPHLMRNLDFRLWIPAYAGTTNGIGAESIPKPVGYVNDFAHILNSNTKSKLNMLAKELDAKTGVELVIVTVKSINGDDIFDYSVNLFQKWGIGKKGKDNGVLFLVDVKDRKMRIDTGYGVEGFLPDGLLGRIRDNYIIPYFKKGDYNAGILNGSAAIANITAHHYNITLNGSFKAKKAHHTLGLINLILLIGVIIALGPYLFPMLLGLFFGSYNSDWDNNLGGGFGGGFGGFGGGSTGGGGIGGNW